MGNGIGYPTQCDLSQKKIQMLHILFWTGSVSLDLQIHVAASPSPHAIGLESPIINYQNNFIHIDKVAREYYLKLTFIEKISFSFKFLQF